MTRITTRSAALAAILTAGLLTHHASATAITTGVNLPNGSFATTLSGSGNAQITGASGNFRTWTNIIVFISTNTGITAGNQTVGLNMPNVNINNNVASGSGNITYDNVAPPTPLNLNSLNGDLNGAGGANQLYNFTINTTNALNLTASVLGIPTTLPLNLTVNGQITDATFNSTGSSSATPSYGIPGNLALTLQATVTGSIALPLGLGNLSLGTLFTLSPTVISNPLTLPGTMLLTDLSGGAGPYPANMGVDLSAAVPFSIPVPLTLPFALASIPDPGDHIQGITRLTINPGSQLNLTLNIGNPSYDLNGTLPLAVVPEPSSFALAGLALFGLTALIRRRKKAA